LTINEKISLYEFRIENDEKIIATKNLEISNTKNKINEIYN